MKLSITVSLFNILLYDSLFRHSINIHLQFNLFIIQVPLEREILCRVVAPLLLLPLTSALSSSPVRRGREEHSPSWPSLASLQGLPLPGGETIN